jgi:hypothetical protein
LKSACQLDYGSAKAEANDANGSFPESSSRATGAGLSNH